uniref:NADH-ubiquinone oxidoreductase chain 5 n=1 Tax=Chelus fimbriata TaxID=44495 RepID=G0XMP1_CHEFI|nr:NADH dehydrogenase subunit 5 [Chelus fimbriata]ADN12046.1 NADH dehydrogenase subunit 5 [Chelus fimbriata]
MNTLQSIDLKTLYLLQLLILSTPLIMSLIPALSTWTWTPKQAITASMYMSIMLFIMKYHYTNDYSISTLFKSDTLNITMNVKFDMYSTTFMPIALFITRTIMDYSEWYMASDKQRTKFYQYLLIFLLAMLTLVTANNLFLMFIGWEGVGLMSFMLITWWRSRLKANESSMQAIIYNRIGDIGLIMTICWLFLLLDTLDLSMVYSMSHIVPTTPILGLILAATAKSAQFGMHPWLLAAMEGPTPVSALLHSSTMVVAGIYLLIQMQPLLTNNSIALSTCLFIGSITTLYAATHAMTKNDIKEIIAYSTLSQLGLMMVTMGLCLPKLAFMHLCLHAFFKSMLFLCAGNIIHAMHGEQDIRKMGALHKTLPTTSSCFTIGTLALAGMPFLSSFYSKDIIIESMLTSKINTLPMIMVLMATSFTTVYSLRVVATSLTGQPMHTPLPHYKEDTKCTKPISKLAVSSIMAGTIMLLTMTPPQLTQMTMPTTYKLMAPMIMIIGLLFASNITLMTHLKPTQASSVTLIHRLTSTTTLSKAEEEATRLMDQMWYTKLGPESLPNHQKPPIMATTTQKGLIKPYLLSFVYLLTLIPILLWPTH